MESYENVRWFDVFSQILHRKAYFLNIELLKKEILMDKLKKIQSSSLKKDIDWAVELLLDAQSRGFMKLLMKRLEKEPRYIFFHKMSLGLEVSFWLSQLGFTWSNRNEEVELSIEALVRVLSQLINEKEQRRTAFASARGHLLDKFHS